MLKIVALYLCWTIFLVSGDGNKSVPVSPNSSSAIHVAMSADAVGAPIEPTNPTSPKPITTTPITTTKPTTTTTKPTTTTTKPTTTTKVPPTPPPSPAPNTTTHAPETTTQTPTTTPGPTPAPTPLPPPKMGQWIVNGTNHTICIVVKMAVEFNITYMAKDNKTKHYLMNMPNAENATVASGDCGAAEQTLNVTWNGGDDSLVLHFMKNDTTKKYYMHHVQVILSASDIPDIKSNETLQFIHEANEFSTGMPNSYRCMKSQALSLQSAASNSTMTISDLQFQAFKTDKATNFGQAQDCSPDVPDVVPIAVGCALTILVIIVLAAYLIGRRRNQARGYLSM